jgi:hypothetical protein
VVKVEVASRGNDWVCEVAVEQGGERSHHTVTVTPGDLTRWGSGEGPEAVRDLVQRSFAFLLEREPPSSILPSFELAVIRRYFPDYDQQFKK